MKRLLFAGLVALMLVPVSARAEVLLPAIIDVLVDGGNNYAWQKVELPGTVCGNGSQYKFWIRKTELAQPADAVRRWRRVLGLRHL